MRGILNIGTLAAVALVLSACTYMEEWPTDQNGVTHMEFGKGSNTHANAEMVLGTRALGHCPHGYDIIKEVARPSEDGMVWAWDIKCMEYTGAK